MEKTNAMRILDKQKIEYKAREYDVNLTEGKLVAQACGLDGQQVFKTLVTVGNDLNHYVFVVPVDETLSLKKAAKAVGVKSVAMIKQKELFPLTGYIHGGCSPIGMKKQFKTVINDTATLFDTICFSGGKVGLQLEASPCKIADFLGATFVDVIEY
ncbi:MAG: Cys-tRNA(Pro) deacylase [Clostridia bacterium]|nr:Cys-tRNA(Pro) deacylase [Clostridia bacterium]